MSRNILDQFDAGAADRVVEIIAADGAQMSLPREDVQLGTRMLWTLGQVPAVTSVAQCEEYLQQLCDIVKKKLGSHGHERDVFGAFIRTRDGALAIALACRIDEWRKWQGH
jgi:hypothetical protein